MFYKFTKLLLIAIILLSVTACGNNPIENAYSPETVSSIEASAEVPKETEYINEAESIMQEIEKQYENYALNKVEYQGENAEKSNAVGEVSDQLSGEKLKGVKVSFRTIEVETDENGRFQIVGYPSGFYEFVLEKEGYKTARYSNYPISEMDGVDIFSFVISKTEELTEDYLANFHDHIIDADKEILYMLFYTADAKSQQSVEALVEHMDWDEKTLQEVKNLALEQHASNQTAYEDSQKIIENPQTQENVEKTVNAYNEEVHNNAEQLRTNLQELLKNDYEKLCIWLDQWWNENKMKG